MNNKKSLIDRLELIKVESGHSDKTFKNTLATITGKTSRTIRRWYSLESSIHETDIERIAKYFGKHVQWLRYGDRQNISSAVDEIMSSDHFGAVILKDDKIEEANFKFLEMLNLSKLNIKHHSICDYIAQLQPEQTFLHCKQSHEHAIKNGVHLDQMEIFLGDNNRHIVESTTLNLNNGRVLRIIFDKGLADTSGHQDYQTSPVKKHNVNGTSLNILFVDDDIANCQLYNSMLSIHDCEVTTFTSSLHALNEFKQNHDHYDVLISDIIMPDMTGDKLAHECRQVKPQLPVVLCTGYAAHLNKTTAEEFDVSYYLQKPINSSELLSILDKLR